MGATGAVASKDSARSPGSEASQLTDGSMVRSTQGIPGVEGGAEVGESGGFPVASSKLVLSPGYYGHVEDQLRGVAFSPIGP
eukprot:Skav233597  [mRNA]  locus=scaffold2520:711601:711846:- [translate_table: standard]